MRKHWCRFVWTYLSWSIVNRKQEYSEISDWTLIICMRTQDYTYCKQENNNVNIRSVVSLQIPSSILFVSPFYQRNIFCSSEILKQRNQPHTPDNVKSSMWNSSKNFKLFQYLVCFLFSFIWILQFHLVSVSGLVEGKSITITAISRILNIICTDLLE